MTEQINTADVANTSNNSIEETKSVEEVVHTEENKRREMPAGYRPPIIMDSGCGVIKAGLSSEERPSVVLNNM